jgi:hypothetical protein
MIAVVFTVVEISEKERIVANYYYKIYGVIILLRKSKKSTNQYR